MTPRSRSFRDFPESSAAGSKAFENLGNASVACSRTFWNPFHAAGLRSRSFLSTYTARSYEADCRLAGFKELAKRVRPSVSRPGRTEEEPDETGLPPVPQPGQNTSSLLPTPPVSDVPAPGQAVGADPKGAESTSA